MPAKRKHLLSFQGEFKVLADLVRQSVIGGDNDQSPDDQILSNQRKLQGLVRDNPVFNGQSKSLGANLLGSSVTELLNLEKTIVDTLKRMQSIYRDDGFHFEFSCDQERIFGVNGEWSLCGPDSLRHQLLKDSTFSLILAPSNTSIVSTVQTQTRIFEALKYGAIPVILGDNIRLPYEEIINWKDASIVLPKARVTELHFYMRSLGDSDILSMRRQGRIIWETYMGSTQAMMDTVLAIVRTRLHIPAHPMWDASSASVFNDSYRPLWEDVIGNGLHVSRT